MQVLGASVDKPAANERWAQQHGLKMPLLSDATGERQVGAAFDVLKETGGAKRTTFLIEADGTLARVYENVTARGHAAQVLADIDELWGERAA
ncbi:MAG TPA: redoxin domain-containing protein [Thermoleophilia bacterium]|nr:redoxin domain-containing protein [Thermoleophilia bacterium]